MYPSREIKQKLVLQPWGCLCFCLVALLVWTPATSQQVYIVDGQFASPKLFHYSQVNSSLDTLLLPKGSQPQAVTQSNVTGHLYWTELNYSLAHPKETTQE